MPAGLRHIGHDAKSFCFDNETPRHRVYLGAFEMAASLVSNGDYLGFIFDGGYERPELWLAEGWDTRVAQGWHAPLYWSREGESWLAFTLHGTGPVCPDEPVCHVSYYEADAYARWAGARLPSEAEWETFAAERPVRGNLLESRRFHPCVAAGQDGASQVFGDVWEWTQTCHRRVHVDAAGAVLSEVPACTIKVLDGQHRTPMSFFIRDAKSGGCSVGIPPDNLGFRLVRQQAWYEPLLALFGR